MNLTGCHSPSTRVAGKFDNGTPEVVHELPDRNDTLNYTLKIYYPSGRLHRTVQVENGKYIGVMRTYYEKGDIYELDSLTTGCDIGTGECDGIRTIFYENGILAEKFFMRAGRYTGMSFHYDEKGHLAKAYNLLDTLKNGVYKEFYENGKVLRLATYHLDTLVGNEYVFKETGDTLKYYSHYKGQLDFPYKIWLDDGNTLYGIRSKEEKVLWTWQDKNGQIIRRKIVFPSKSGFVVPH